MDSSEMFSFSSKLFYDKRYVGSDGYATVYIQVVIDSKHREFNLKLRWPAELINRDKCELKSRKDADSECFDFNLIIKAELAKYSNILTTYRLRNQPLNIQSFSREVKGFDQKSCFYKYMEVESLRLLEKKEIERKTRQNVIAVMRLVMEYDPLSLFANIDKKWMAGYKSFLQRKQFKPGKFYKPLNIWDRIKVVKAYLKKASGETMIYVKQEAHEFPNPNPETETIFLNKLEIIRFIDLLGNNTLTKIERNVLKAFLFTCFTSLRISDVYRVGSRWLIGQDFLKFIPNKNAKRRRELIIPLSPLAKQFINTTTYYYFDLPTQVEYNRTLKDLALKASINKRVFAHVGRHTFGYLYMTTVGNIYGLQEILGHKRIETTLRYSHLDEEYQLSSVIKMQDGFEEFTQIQFIA
jgi:integrase